MVTGSDDKEKTQCSQLVPGGWVTFTTFERRDIATWAQWVPTSCLHTASIVCWFSECFSSKSKENVIVVDICLKSSFFGFFLKITAKNLLDGIVLFTDESVVLICMTQRIPVCWCNTLDRAIPDLFTTVQSHGSLGGTAIATDLSAITWYSFLLVWLKSWHTGVMIWYGTMCQTLSFSLPLIPWKILNI